MPYNYVVPVLLLIGGAAGAASTTSPSDAPAEAAYSQAIAKRADDIVAALKLPDAPAADRVRQALIDRYRELRAWHDNNDARLRSLGYRADREITAEQPAPAATEIRTILQSLADTRAHFLERLRADLTPAQVDVVKDKLTYGKLDVTYNAYLEIFPRLTTAQKAHIRQVLTEAREVAIDGGSSEEKSAIFKLYKNRCKAYLTAEGYDVDQAYRDWGAAQKRRAATTRADGA